MVTYGSFLNFCGGRKRLGLILRDSQRRLRSRDCDSNEPGDSYMNEAEAVVVQEVLEGLGQSFVGTADQQAAFVVGRSDGGGNNNTKRFTPPTSELFLQTLMRTNKTRGSRDVADLWRRRPIRAADSENIRTSTDTI